MSNGVYFNAALSLHKETIAAMRDQQCELARLREREEEAREIMECTVWDTAYFNRQRAWLADEKGSE